MPHPGLEYRTQEAAGRKRCWLASNPQQPTTGEHKDAGSCWGHLQVEDGGAGALRLLEHQAALLVEHRVHAAQRLLRALHNTQHEGLSAAVRDIPATVECSAQEARTRKHTGLTRLADM